MAGVPESEEEGVVTLEGKNLPVSFTKEGAEQQERESDSAARPLLQHAHQDSCDDNHRADAQTATDAADRETSAPRAPELAQHVCSGSIRSLCSDGSRHHECPICGEQFDSHGDHHITSLNCNHTLCHHCVAGIMRRAKDPSRLRCPFCRQNTPFPQWEIRRLQEESYSNGVYEAAPVLIVGPGPEPEAVRAPPLCCFTLTRTDTCGHCTNTSCLTRGLRRIRRHPLCLPITALLLLFLVTLGCFLYMAVPVMMLSLLLND